MIRDQVVGDAVQIGAAVAQQAAGGDFDDTQPGFLDDVIGVAALREFAADTDLHMQKRNAASACRRLT